MASVRQAGNRRHPTTQLRKQVKAERQAVYLRAIADAAERVFAEKGTDKSPMRAIAAEAGISLGTLYGVIDGKKELFYAIHETRMLEFLKCIRSARDACNTTLESHLAVLREGAKYFLERPHFLRMCCRDGYGWASSLPASARGSNLRREGIAIPEELFARGIAEGLYVDEDSGLLARKMLALKQVELTHWVEQGMKTAPERVLERLEDQFTRAFCKLDR